MTLAFSFLFFTDVNLVPPNQIQHARSHPALHVQLGTCLHRPQYLGFLVHRHLVWVDRALEHYQHMATQTKPKCPSCICTCTCSFPVVFNTLSGWNTKIYEDHNPYLHIGSGAGKVRHHTFAEAMSQSPKRPTASGSAASGSESQYVKDNFVPRFDNTLTGVQGVAEASGVVRQTLGDPGKGQGSRNEYLGQF